MKRALSLLGAAVALVLIAGAVFMLRPGAAPPAAAVDLSRTKPTAAGLYVASIAPEMEPVQRGELHSWVLTLTTPDGKPVEGAVIAVDGGMPEHNHGLPTAPQATAYLGDGRYRIEGVKFTMTGRWELRFGINAAAGDDSVTFELMM